MTNTEPPARPFKVVYDFHVADGVPTRMVRSFRTEEEARTYAKVCTPDGDPKVFPNVRRSSWEAFEAEGFEYWSGVFWHDNRSAVIMGWSSCGA